MRDREAATDRSARTPVRARVLVTGLVAGALVGGWCGLLLAPPSGARFEARLPWPGTPPSLADANRDVPAGERARLVAGRHGPELLVTAGTAARARARVREIVSAHAPGSAALTADLERARARWRQALVPAPVPALTSRAECAALLLARARWGRELADALPLAAPASGIPELVVPDGVIERWLDVLGAAESADPPTLAVALEEASRHEAGWFSDAGEWSGWTTPARAEAWRRCQRVRAASLEAAARALLANESELQRRLADGAAGERLVELDARLGDPWVAFATEPRAVRPLVRPIVAAWLPPLLAGALAGALLSGLALVIGAWLRPPLARVRVRPGGPSAADPAEAGPRLHVVTGATPSAVTRAAFELAARRMAFGERVLLVDGSSRLRLHERLGRDARWGLLECMVADMPMLGLVQYAGHPGLYLLPHGDGARTGGWSSLGRKLDEVLPHFGRTVLALDPHAPLGLCDALRGRAMEGWWSGADGRFRTAAEQATARFGIVLHGLDLSALSEPTLEALGERVRTLRPPGPAPEPAPITARVEVRRPELPRPPLEPIVLDCDLQVRQRLRFLAWMRRVQAENRRAGVRATS